MLKNPYTRIFIAAALATLITPRIVNAFTVPEIEDSGGNVSGDIRNTVMAYGVAGAATAAAYTILTMALGPSAPAGA